MSYEGHEQHLCAKGHQWDAPCMYGEDADPCPWCKSPSVWFNPVDETNCESVGEILGSGWASLQLTPSKVETCSLGYQHTEPATYRQPTQAELDELRHYLVGDQWVPCNHPVEV